MGGRITAPVTACVVVIGNEILSGRTHDVNIRFLARELGALGVRVTEARVIPDDAEVIVSTVNEVRLRFDYVFTTGGIGPTHDDITSAAIARAFGVPLLRHPEAEAVLRAYYGDDPARLTPARLKMAEMPLGAELIDNPVSRAPGFRIDNLFVLAGVPAIVEGMFVTIRDRIRGGAPMMARTVTADLPEGDLAPALSAIQDRHPETEIGSYPFFRQGRLGVSVVIRGPEAAPLERAAQAVREAMENLGATPRDVDR